MVFIKITCISATKEQINSTFLWNKLIWFKNMWRQKEKSQRFINLAAPIGRKSRRKLKHLYKISLMTSLSYMQSGKLQLDMDFHLMVTCSVNLKLPLHIKKRKTSSGRFMKLKRTWKDHGPWTGFFAATLVTVKRKWPSVQPSRQLRMESR